MSRIISFFLLLVFAATLHAGKKIAIVTNTKYDKEFKILQKNPEWSTERFIGAELPELAKRFKEFDLVINGTSSGHQEKTDWKAVHPQLEDYLKSGGALLLVDANYPCALPAVIHSFGKDFQAWFLPCSTRGDAQRVTRRTWDRNLSVNVFPHDLQGIFADFPIWQHLACPKPWVSMAKCSDNMCAMMYRDFEKGTIYCISYFDFGNGKSHAFLALVDNILAAVDLKSAGLVMESIQIGGQFGANTLDTRFAVTSAPRQMHLEWSVTQGNVVLAAEKRTVDFKTGQKYDFSIPYTVSSYAAPLDVRINIAGAPKEIVLKAVRQVSRPLTLAPWRNEVYPLIAGNFPVGLSVAPGFLDASRYEIRFHVGDREVKAEKIREDLWHCDLGLLSPGDHLLQAAVFSKEKKEKVFTAEAPLTVWERDPRYAVGPDNVLRIGEQKIFPVGFYHISWKLPDASRLAAVDFVKKAGARFLFAAKRPSDPGFTAFLNHAEAQGVRVIIEPAGAAENHPAIAGYAIGDEPDSKSIKPELLTAKQKAGRKKCFDLFSTMVLMTPAGFTDAYLRCADLIGHDPYPLPKAPISMVYYNMRALVKKLDATSRLPFVVPQAFGYKDHAFYKIPEPSEIRNMTYQALVAGARGILFYTYQDPGFDLNQHPALYDEMLKLTQEIRELEHFFIDAGFTEIITGTKDVFGARWQLSGESLEILVNSGKSKAVLKRNGEVISLAPLEVDIRRKHH